MKKILFIVFLLTQIIAYWQESKEIESIPTKTNELKFNVIRFLGFLQLDTSYEHLLSQEYSWESTS